MDQNKLFARAQEIAAQRECTLSEAMAVAEMEARPVIGDVPDTFEVVIRVKPRVARWIVQEFGGHRLPLEERLGAYLSEHLGRKRMEVIRLNEDPASIKKGDAVTVRRDRLDEALKGGDA